MLYLCWLFSYFSLIHNIYLTNLRLRISRKFDDKLICWKIVNYLTCRKPGFVGDSTPRFCETCCQDRGFTFCIKELFRWPLFMYTANLCHKNRDEAKEFKEIIPILYFLCFQNIIFLVQGLFLYLIGVCLEECVKPKPVPELIDTRTHFVTHNNEL